MSKKLCLILLFISVVCLCGAEAQNSKLKELEIKFYGGSLTDKIETVQQAVEMDGSVNGIFTDALIFVEEYSPILQEDVRMVKLARIIIENSSRITGYPNLAKTLCSLFYTYSDKTVKIAVMNVIKNYKPDNEFVYSMNEFALSCLTNYSVGDTKNISDIIDALGSIKDLSSVRVLFEFSVNSILPEILTKKAQETLLAFSPDYKNEIISILNSGSPEKKLIAFRVVVKNDVDTDFFKAEIAEKALSNAITYMGTSVSAEPHILTLQFEALSELRRVAWTRSSGVIVNLFKVAEKEFQSGYINEDSFIEVMNGLV